MAAKAAKSELAWGFGWPTAISADMPLKWA